MTSLSWHTLPVFVYGTLKREQPNHFILETAISKSQAKFLGQATTVDCWPLIVHSQFNVPFLLDCKHTGNVSSNTLTSFLLFDVRALPKKCCLWHVNSGVKGACRKASTERLLNYDNCCHSITLLIVLKWCVWLGIPMAHFPLGGDTPSPNRTPNAFGVLMVALY